MSTQALGNLSVYVQMDGLELYAILVNGLLTIKKSYNNLKRHKRLNSCNSVYKE